MTEIIFGTFSIWYKKTMNQGNTLAELLHSLSRPRLREIPEKGTVFRQGDPAGEIYQVVSGRIRLVRYTDQGESLTLFRAQAGQTFAEAALFSGIYHCTAMAESASRIAGFAKKELLAVLESHPPVMLRLIALLSRQVRDLRTLLEIRSIQAAPERVMQYLKVMADPGSGVFTVATTMKDVAQELGLAHETLYRVLASLEKDKKIEKEGKTIRFPSPPTQGTLP